ncbi:MAG TPA: helicase-related protein [Acetobacteraceae bacterium]|nr:helicase-related protein [Acetobacteraceae bacterium]
MELQPGSRVRARGLVWDVLAVERSADRECLDLRCVDGDMAGLEWQIYVPPDQVERVDQAFDPECPAPLSLWHLMHRAHVLNALPDATSFVVRDPGRIRVEPYQLVPLMRALDMPRPRLLLADGVGLGKTIQAGLIAAEFIARRRAHRILIVAPSGPLLWQWEQETRLRFGLKFTLITNAAELWDIRCAHELGANPFDTISLCITALDFAKQDHVLEELERSAWDLVIIDEAHHCIGYSQMSQENTYRRRLAEVLARRSDGMLLVTATPHDGHDAHFASLIALLDPSLVDGAGGFVGRDYRRHVIRRLKAHIRDPHTGAPLFRRRHVIHVKVDVHGNEHETVREFHRVLAAFVVPRLRRRTGNDDALAFVSLLKRSVSTISACLETLRVVTERLARQRAGEVETKAARQERARALRAWRRRAARFGTLDAADEANQQALEVESMAEALRLEPDAEPAHLIRLGIAAEAHDPKLSAILLEVRMIRLRHRRANILIYTEYTDSQVAAARALRAARGIEGEVLSIGGQDDDRSRAAAAQRFGECDGLILISTDSLAEGLNLHRHCFHLIHLDLPYNPNRLEQRNGRIDRYGQQCEPEIRYLYIPGTFEENLLLHLIAKYEKARSSLDVMPDTLGVTAGADDYQGPLTGGLSEDPSDLFQPDEEVIRTLDRAVSDVNPQTVADLMREIDRAFAAFDLMAVHHGWYGARGYDAGMDQINCVEQARHNTDGVGDLSDFIAAVIEAETHQPAISPHQMRLPADWTRGLEGMPGFDPAASILHFTSDLENWRDTSGRDIGFFGRAHPLVLRAIRHGCRLPGVTAVSQGEHLGLLLTFQLEIAAARRVVFREMVAVLASPDRPPEECRDWLALGTQGHFFPSDGVWHRLFSPWADVARSAAEHVVAQIASRRYATFVAEYEATSQQETVRSRHWLRVKADQLCGTFIAPTRDLFGAAASGPIWQHQEDPVTRLVSFATNRDVTGSKRREANDALDTFRAMQAASGKPSTVVSRAIGMLMLVPADAP